jgi:cyclophilin family peptidyl-prolyl cis-trans isomerase
MKKIIMLIGLLVVVLAGVYALTNQNSGNEQPLSKEELSQLKGQQVVFQTNKGNFVIELYPEKSPLSVSNFISYVKQGFYEGTIFHRALPGVIIQGGGFSKGMNLKASNRPVKNESSNLLPNVKGSVSIARKDSADSGTSQFFINLRNNAELDHRADKPGYAVFAKVVEGLDVLEEMAKSKTEIVQAHKNVPVDDIFIQSVKLMTKPSLKEVGASTEVSGKLEEFQEGVHYVRLKTPLPLLNTKKVEVVAAFSYGCGHCYGLYGPTRDWKASQRKKIDFSYFHAVWSDSMRTFARTYYTAIELGVDESIHVPLYEAIVIHQQKLSNRDELASFFESYGVDRAKFIEIFDSERIVERVGQAEKLTKAFNLASVPEFIVAGKYRLDPMRAGGTAEIFAVMDFLIEKESSQ